MIAGRKLLILDGVHVGAELFLDDGVYLIGAGLDSDMVLLDLGIDKQHLRLHVEGNHVTVERLENSQVMLHGAAMNEMSFTILDGDVVRLGTAAFSVTTVVAGRAKEMPELLIPAEVIEEEASTDTKPGAPLISPRRRGRFVLPFSLITVLLGMGAFFGSRALEAPLSPLAAQPAGASVQTKQQNMTSTSSATEKKDDFVARVREFIGDDALAVQLDAHGQIVVSGSTAKEVVREQLQRIQKEYAGTIEIIDEISYVIDKAQRNKLPMPQRITDVSIGQVRWFRTADGTRNFEGSQLADGAEVVRISLDSIVFRRNGKLTVFRLNEKE